MVSGATPALRHLVGIEKHFLVWAFDPLCHLLSSQVGYNNFFGWNGPPRERGRERDGREKKKQRGRHRSPVADTITPSSQPQITPSQTHPSSIRSGSPIGPSSDASSLLLRLGRSNGKKEKKEIRRSNPKWNGGTAACFKNAQRTYPTCLLHNPFVI